MKIKQIGCIQIFLQATVILDTFLIPKMNINELTIIIFGVMKTDFIN